MKIVQAFLKNLLRPETLIAFLVLSAGIALQAQNGTVESLRYYSTTQNDSCDLNIYLPPGYTDVSNTDSFPVLYLMHGGGEDYTYWVNYGNADEVMDDYIPNEVAVPMIIVMPDGRNLQPDVFSNAIRNDIIPYIESNYRVIADKDHRGMAGLSWGGQQSLEVGILHYELFGYLAIMSSGYFSDDNYNEAAAKLETDAAAIEASMRYFYFAEGTKYDLTYESGMRALALFREHGLTVHYWEYPGGHQWTVWREDFKSFTPYLFRDTTTRYISLEFMGGRIKNSTVMTYLDSLAPEPETPTRTGYTFAGWYLQPEYVDSFNFATDTVKSNFTLYADWSINSYKVSFNSNGGNYTPDTIVAVYNTRIEAPEEPTKDGFVFDGWYTDDTYIYEWVFDVSKVTGDITLIAKWVDPLDASDLETDGIMVFPNPATDVVQLRHLPPGASLDVISAEGKRLISKRHLNQEEAIDISQLSEGIYILLVYSDAQIYRFRILKK